MSRGGKRKAQHFEIDGKQVLYDSDGDDMINWVNYNQKGLFWTFLVSLSIWVRYWRKLSLLTLFSDPFEGSLFLDFWATFVHVQVWESIHLTMIQRIRIITNLLTQIKAFETWKTFNPTSQVSFYRLTLT